MASMARTIQRHMYFNLHPSFPKGKSNGSNKWKRVTRKVIAV